MKHWAWVYTKSILAVEGVSSTWLSFQACVMNRHTNMSALRVEILVIFRNDSFGGIMDRSFSVTIFTRVENDATSKVKLPWVAICYFDP